MLYRRFSYVGKRPPHTRSPPEHGVPAQVPPFVTYRTEVGGPNRHQRETPGGTPLSPIPPQHPWLR